MCRGYSGRIRLWWGGGLDNNKHNTHEPPAPTARCEAAFHFTASSIIVAAVERCTALLGGEVGCCCSHGERRTKKKERKEMLISFYGPRFATALKCITTLTLLPSPSPPQNSNPPKKTANEKRRKILSPPVPIPSSREIRGKIWRFHFHRIYAPPREPNLMPLCEAARWHVCVFAMFIAFLSNLQ